MSDRDIITLPREVAEHLTKMLEECPLLPNADWSERDCAALTALRKALAAEQPSDDVKALRRDAERYRYLRNRDPAEVLSKEGRDAGCWIDCEEKGGIAYKLQLLTGDDADAAIDAAMKEDKT